MLMPISKTATIDKTLFYDSITLALKVANVDITGFEGFEFFPISWCNFEV